MKKRIMLSLLTLAALTAPGAALAFDDATAKSVGFEIQAFTGSFKGIQDPAQVGLIDSIINILNALLVLIAVAAIAFVIIGGLRYITAQGDEDAIAAAKNTVIFAILGIIVVLLAAVIVNFFLAQIG